MFRSHIAYSHIRKSESYQSTEILTYYYLCIHKHIHIYITYIHKLTNCKTISYLCGPLHARIARVVNSVLQLAIDFPTQRNVYSHFSRDLDLYLLIYLPSDDECCGKLVNDSIKFLIVFFWKKYIYTFREQFFK